jgi:hypothetical protein
VIIDLPATRLDNVDILPTDAVLDLAAAAEACQIDGHNQQRNAQPCGGHLPFANLKLGENPVAWWDAECEAYILDEFRMGVASKDDDVAHHDCGVSLVARLGKAHQSRVGSLGFGERLGDQITQRRGL